MDFKMRFAHWDEGRKYYSLFTHVQNMKLNAINILYIDGDWQLVMTTDFMSHMVNEVS